MSSERNGIWAKIMGTVIPLAVAGLIAWGSLNERVNATAGALEKKANKETVTVQYEEIIRRLDAIDRKMEQP